MYAIVDIAGQQFKVEKDKKVFVHRLDNKQGDQVNFDKVLLIDNNGKVTIGEPVIEGAAVVAKVVDHLKGDKVFVFKKKRRKGFRKFNGHRQYLSQIIIEDIIEKGFKPQPVVKKSEVKKEPVVKAEKVEKAEVVENEAPKAKAVAKKPEATEKAAKPAAKAATEKKAAPKAKAETKKAAPKKTTAKTTAKKSTK